MTDLLIRLLFWLLGHTYTRQYNIPYLFGASTANHAARKRKWENALVRLWKDKEMLDFLYYQAESDKENVFRGKVDKRLAQGARIRTLFLVYSARRAYEDMRKSKMGVQDKANSDAEMKGLAKIYRDTVDIEPLTEN